MVAKIEQIEDEMMRAKDWQMTGEVKAKERPVNSLLEVHLDFNTATGVLSGTSRSSIDTTLFTVTATNIHGRSSVDIYLTVTANQRIQSEAPAMKSVRFPRGSSKMNSALIKQLDEWLQQELTGTTTLTAVVPKSGNGSTLARKRAVQVRKYLRANDAAIGSTIKIMIAPKKTMTRRVLLLG